MIESAKDFGHYPVADLMTMSEFARSPEPRTVKSAGFFVRAFALR